MPNQHIKTSIFVAAVVAVAVFTARKTLLTENNTHTRHKGESTMSHAVKEIKDSEFSQTIATGVVLVDFWAPWCGPCRMQGPILEEVAKELGDTSATIAKVNIDENNAAAQQFGVRSIPTLLLFKDGKLIKQYVGVQQKGELVSTIRKKPLK